jgi:hypothetical protein
MQLLGRAKFLTEDENHKGKVKFLKGGEFPKVGELPRNCRGGRNSWDTCESICASQYVETTIHTGLL